MIQVARSFQTVDWSRPLLPYHNRLQQRKWDVTPAGFIAAVILILMKLHQDSSAATCFRIWSQHATRTGSLQSWLELRRNLVFRIWLEASCRVEGYRVDAHPPSVLRVDRPVDCGSFDDTVMDDPRDLSHENDDEVVVRCQAAAAVTSHSATDPPAIPKPQTIPTIVVTPPDDEPPDWLEMQVPDQCSLGGLRLVVPGRPCYDDTIEEAPLYWDDFDSDDESPTSYVPSLPSEGDSCFWLEEDEEDLPDLSDWEC